MSEATDQLSNSPLGHPRKQYSAQSFRQPAVQSSAQRAEQSFTQPADPPADLPADRHANQTADLPVNQSTDSDPSSIAAFFDIDETLVRGASSFWAAKEMFLHRLFGVRDLAFAARQTLRFVLFGENQDRIKEFTDRAAGVVAGCRVDDLRKLGEEIFARYFVPNAYHATLARLTEHIEAGHQVFLVSATPWIIAEVFAEKLGATLGIGTRLKVSDGKLLAELDGPVVHGLGKVSTVLALAQERGIDLNKSWAYSDSSGDIPLLSLVGNPVAVNPDLGLRTYADLRGWEMLFSRTRKDRVKRIAILSGGAGLGGGLCLAAIYVCVRAWRRKLS